MPKVMVGQYEQQLRQLTTTLSDYRGKRKYPSSWPANLSAYEIVIEALVSLYKLLVDDFTSNDCANNSTCFMIF
jgi:hypothetical protein